MKSIKLLATALVASCVLAPAWADSKNADIYGTVAFGLMSTENSAGVSNTEVLNESRIGFQGSKVLPKLGDTKFVWQIESGFMGPNGLSAQPYESGTLGTRDTWAGFEGGFGKVRVGRLLTPYGETLDWPFANGGVGPLVESTSVPGGGSYVRESDQFRWDSVATGPLTASVSFGRGTRSTSAGNAFVAANSSSLSGVVHYAVGGATLHAGYEKNGNRSANSGENTNLLLAAQSPSFGGFSLYGAYIKGTSTITSTTGSYTPGNYDRATNQFALQYATGDWISKISYAKNQDLSGPVADKGGDITAIQVLYIVDPSLVTYARYVSASNPNTTAGWWNKSRVLIGMEYGF